MSSKLESSGNGGIFSPALQDPATPDSSDSNDELKYPDVEKKGRLYQGSVHFSNCDIIKLNKLLPTAITFSRLKSNFVTNLTMALLSTIMKGKTSQHKPWMLKFLVYVFLFFPESCQQALNALQEYTQGEDAAISRLISSTEVLKQKNWTSEEIESLFGLCFTDLTRKSIELRLFNRSLDEINLAIQEYSTTIPWTQQESRILHEYADDVEHVVHNLPCRTRTEIQKRIDEYVSNQPERRDSSNLPEKRDFLKLQDYSNLPENINEIETEENKINSSSIDSFPDIQFADTMTDIISPIPEVISPLTEVITPTTLNQSDKTVQKYLSLAICHDLTLDALTKIFPTHELPEVLNMVRSFPDFKDHELTAGEKVRMKELVKINASLDEIASQLPCRNEQFLQEKRKDYFCIGVRKTNFTSATEQLIYEAQWHMLTSGTNSNDSRRSRRRKHETDLQELQDQVSKSKKKTVKVKSEESATQIEARLQKMEIKIKEKEERKLQIQQKRQQNRENRALGLVAPKPKSRKFLNDLISGCTHFQSVSGDKKPVEVGQKRRRIKPEIYQSELKTRPRQQRKNEIKNMIKLQNQKVSQKVSQDKISAKVKKSIPEIKPENDKLNMKRSKNHPEPIFEEEIIKSEEVEEDFVSPYDPTDINTDTLVPLNNRHLFVSEFYKADPNCPYIDFHDNPNSDSYEIMAAMDTKVLFDDDLAYHIVQSHTKNYRSLPISFPSLMDPSNDKQLNPINKVRLRFLLYPQHTELFVLGQPKSNELDPVYEIIKLMMIHWALYFSHSEKLKEFISTSYCKKLELSVEENDFGVFVETIDRWNLLMLELSPNTSGVMEIKQNGTVHLNAEIKKYLGPDESLVPSLKDLELELELFYLEIILENISPSYQLIKTESVPKQHMFEYGIEIPDVLATEMNPLKPDNYTTSFFQRLQEKTDVSRFAIQQILLRVYSRVVSTDSRKLRSYKAFTAEVYGELLPSFTSEVLEKVNLLPSQKFYDLGSGVGNTTFQAALEFGAAVSGGCELMEHASKLTELQQGLMAKHLSLFGLKELNLDFALLQSFVDNEKVCNSVLDSDVLIINNYLFDVNLNTSVGKLLYGLRPGTKIISLRDFIRPRYKACGNTVFDYLRVEKHEMSDFLSVSWTANKVPYFISTVEDHVLPEYLSKEGSPESKEGLIESKETSHDKEPSHVTKEGSPDTKEASPLLFS